MNKGLGDLQKEVPPLFPRNKIFEEKGSHFYCELGIKKQIDANDPPTIQETETFWANIWESNKEHNKEASSGEKDCRRRSYSCKDPLLVNKDGV